MNRKKLVSARPVLRALEPRIVFDGAAGEDASGLVAPAIDRLAAFSGGQEFTADLSLRAFVSDGAETPFEASSTEVSQVAEVVFIDTSVADWQTLAANTREGVKVVLIDPSSDSLEQMAGALEGLSGLTSLHVVSHGAGGELHIGNTNLAAENVAQYSDVLARIGDSLADDGDILLYGCDIAGEASGVELLGRLADLTNADLAASSDRTGAAAVGGNWVLEKANGSIESAIFLTAEGISRYGNWLDNISLEGRSGWTAVMYGTAFDPVGDSQAGAADTDIVGEATHGSLYVAFEDNGTDDPNDDTMALRIRIDNPTSDTDFGGVAVVGIDANNDGRIDIFFSVDGRNNGQVVRLLDPGTGDNISPNTTTTSPLPKGWIDSNGVYPMTVSNYSVDVVSASNDPHWDGNTDIGGDGKTDVFVSWRVPLKDVAAVLAMPSPADRNGAYGPRGSAGIPGFDKDTIVRYVGFTQTQTGPINGDLLGVGRDYDKNASFAELGAFTAPMSISEPVAAGPRVEISGPISGDDVVNQSEEGSVSISGTSSGLENMTLNLSVTDGSTTVTGTTTTDGSGNWTVSGIDMSALNDGTLSATAYIDRDGDSGTTDDIVSDTTSFLHNSTAPTVTIDQLATDPSGKPTFSGTSNLPDGGIVTVTIDHDNNSGTAAIVYQVIVSGGVWTLNTATVAPSSGTLTSSGLTSYAKVVATATDAAGNVATDTALTRPTVNALSTNSITPTLSGTWTKLDGDTLEITVGGASYSLTPTGNSWTLDLSTATPSSGSLSLSSGSSYEVVAMVTRGGDDISDTTSSELTITNDPVVSIGINGGTTVVTSDTTPALSGTSGNAGGFVIVRLDPNDDGDLSDAVTWSVATDGSGNWTLDTGVDSPISGLMPTAGFLGDVGVYATDSSGEVSAAQLLTISIPSVAVGSILSDASSDSLGVVSNSSGGESWLNIAEDDSVTISGSATDGFTVDLVVQDANGNSITQSGISVSGGAWSVSGLDLSGLDNSTLSVTATLSGTNISDTDTSVTHDSIAPRIFITNPSEIKKNGGIIYGVSELPNTQLTVTVRDSGDTSTVWTGDVTTDSNGNWTVTTSGNLVSGSSGNVLIKVAPTSAGTTDSAGNIVQQVTRSQYVAANASVQSILIDTVASDDIITVDEIVGGLTITGTTSLTGSGTVSLNVTDGNVTVTVSGTHTSGTWTADLSQVQLQSLSNGQLTLTASAVDGTINIYDTGFATLSLPSPIPTITDDASGSASGPVTFTFTFSEGVTGFTADDVSVTNGSKGTFTAVSASVYTLVVTPAADSSGTIDVSVASAVANGVDTGRGNVDASASQIFNTTSAAEPPTLSIDTTNLVSDRTPVITGTTSLSAGAPIVINVDADNDGVTDLVYFTTVQVGNTWSLNTGTATPASGTFPESGLETSARFTAIATNAYGNSTTVIGLNIPTVVSQITNDTTPTISGTWTQVSGDTLEVVVDGVTYSVANGNLTIDETSWSLTPIDSDAISPDGTYNVGTSVTRSSGGSQTDLSSAELTIDTLASVSISGGDTVRQTNDSSPVIRGVTSDIPAGTVLTLALDIGNDGSTDYTYITVIQSDGSWSIDTSTAIPVSGSLPAGGISLSGEVLLTATATDPAGNVGSDTQVLTVDLDGPVIALTINPKTSDTTPWITGTTDLPAGSTITVYIDPNNDGDWGDQDVYVTTVNQDGTWSVEATTELLGFVGVKAHGQDELGNETTTVAKTLEIVIPAPSISIDALPSVTGEIYEDFVVDGFEDNAIVLGGVTTDVSIGSIITVIVTDGTRTVQDQATVQADGSWSLEALNLSNFSNGTLNVTASVTDAGGTVYSDFYSFEHDKAFGIVVSIDYIDTDTAITSDFITSDNTLTFYGSATPNATVVLDFVGPSGSFSAVSVIATASGDWSYDYSGTTLTDGTYTLTATVGGTPASQVIVVDTVSPDGPISVVSQTTSHTTPVVTGSAVVGAGETLSVSLNGVTYTDGDGNLEYNSVSNSWSLTLPSDAALTPASLSAGFNGVYNVTARISDMAGNVLVDGTSGELTILDSTAPVIDLDPSDEGVTSYTGTSVLGAATGLDDGSDEAVIVEQSGLLRQIDIAISGLLDGSSEKILFGSTVLAANGSSGESITVSVGGVSISIVYDSGTFTLQKANFENFSVAEAQSVVRDLQYRNDAGSVSLGSRTFAFSTQDDAGNVSNYALSSIEVTSQPPAAPTIDLLASSDSGNSSTDDLTNDTTPTLRVTLNGVDGAAPVAGDTVRIYEGPTLVGTVVLTGTNISSGYVDITSSQLAEGNRHFTARVTNQMGSESAASNQLDIEIDVTPPSAALSLDKTALKIGETALLTVSFTEPVLDLSLSDLKVESGSLSSFSTTDGGLTWTATYTPTTGVEDVTNVVQLKTGSISDAAGNVNVAIVSSSNYEVDTVRPSISIASDVSSLIAGESATITFTLSEVSTDFSLSDVSVSGGTLSGFSGSGSVYTATFTPIADSSDPGVISVASSVFSDAAGNLNDDGLDTNNRVSISVDTSAPTIGSDQVFAYAENQLVGAVVGEVLASDHGSIVAFRFVETGTSVSSDGYYSIDALGRIMITSAGVATGIANNDFEIGSNTFSYELEAQDSAGNWSDPATIRLNVTNANDIGPEISDASITLPENSEAGTFVLDASDRFTGSDLDREGDSITYSIIGGNESEAFAIDPLTGQIEVVDGSKLDFGSESSFALTVRASDGTYSDEALISISILEVSSNAPDIVDQSVTIPENSPADTLVVDLSDSFTGTDSDRDGELLTYSIIGGNDSGAFAIDPVTGRITVADASVLDYEGNRSFILRVSASDGTSSDEATIAIGLSNRSEGPVLVDIDLVAGDDIINQTESGIEFNSVSGSVSGEIEPGTMVTILINGTSYTATIDAEMRFSVEAKTSDLIANGRIVASVSYVDADGNPRTSSGERLVDSDLEISVPTVDPQTSSSREPIVTGRVELTTGDIFTVAVNGITYSLGDGMLSVEGGIWTLVIPSENALSDGTYQVVAILTDSSGNRREDTSSSELVIRASGPEAVNDTVEAKEAGGIANTLSGYNASGNLLSNDSGSILSVSYVTSSAGDSLSLSSQSSTLQLDGTFGTLSISADGSYVYMIDDDNQMVESLASSQSLVETYHYTVTDQHGLTSEATLTIRILGAQDDQALVIVPVATPVVTMEPVVVGNVFSTTIVLDPVVNADSSSDKGSSMNTLVWGDDAGSEGVQAEQAGETNDDSQRLGAAGTNLLVTFVPGETSRLMLYRGMPDQYIDRTTFVQFSIPSDAFAHTEREAKVIFEARLVDGTPLPDWLTFDGQTGKFSGTPPSEDALELTIKVIAHDSSGQQVEAVFRIFLGDSQSAPQANRGVSQQFRELAYLSDH